MVLKSESKITLANNGVKMEPDFLYPKFRQARLQECEEYLFKPN